MSVAVCLPWFPLPLFPTVMVQCQRSNAKSPCSVDKLHVIHTFCVLFAVLGNARITDRYALLHQSNTLTERKETQSPDSKIIRKETQSPDSKIIRKETESPDSKIIRKETESPDSKIIRKDAQSPDSKHKHPIQRHRHK